MTATHDHPARIPDASGDVERDQLNPDGMLFTIRKTIPYLKQIGVSQRDIHAMTVENPKRFFRRLSV